MEFVKFDQSTHADNTGWVKWWLILQTILIISKYSVAKDMPWAFVWLPTILLGILVFVGIVVSVIVILMMKK